MREKKIKRADIRRELMAITMAAAAAGTVTAASAATDIFIKIGDIKGESVDLKHKGEIDVLSWSWGLLGPSRNSPGIPQRPVGPPQQACSQSINLSKLTDAASPLLMANAALGKNIPSASLAVRKSEQSQDFLIITLKDVIISGIATAGASGANDSTESVALNFSSAHVTFRPQDDKGLPGAPVEADVPGTCE
jgi:type VI secretion system secreted protein Hcp